MRHSPRNPQLSLAYCRTPRKTDRAWRPGRADWLDTRGRLLTGGSWRQASNGEVAKKRASSRRRRWNQCYYTNYRGAYLCGRTSGCEVVALELMLPLGFKALTTSGVLADGFPRRSGSLWPVSGSWMRQCYCALEALIVPGASNREALSKMRQCIRALSRVTNSLHVETSSCVGVCRIAVTQASSMTASDIVDAEGLCDDACMTLRRQLHTPGSAPITVYASGRLSCGETDALIRCQVGSSPWRRRSWSAKRRG